MVPYTTSGASTPRLTTWRKASSSRLCSSSALQMRGLSSGSRSASSASAPASDLSKPRPSISVVVPTRDRPQALRRCLQALADQTVQGSMEVIVVDDGSLEAGAGGGGVGGSA